RHRRYRAPPRPGAVVSEARSDACAATSPSPQHRYSQQYSRGRRHLAGRGLPRERACIFSPYGLWRPQLCSSRANMNSFRNISLHSRLWIAALATAALSIGAGSIAPAAANAGVGIPISGLYAQYPYYPYPPGYYPYYPPPAPAYPPAPSYGPQPSYMPQAGRSRGNIARQLNQKELNRLQAAPINPPAPYYPYPPPRY